MPRQEGASSNERNNSLEPETAVLARTSWAGGGPIKKGLTRTGGKEALEKFLRRTDTGITGKGLFGHFKLTSGEREPSTSISRENCGEGLRYLKNGGKDPKGVRWKRNHAGNDHRYPRPGGKRDVQLSQLKRNCAWYHQYGFSRGRPTLKGAWPNGGKGERASKQWRIGNDGRRSWDMGERTKLTEEKK